MIIDINKQIVKPVPNSNATGRGVGVGTVWDVLREVHKEGTRSTVETPTPDSVAL